jgi:hypothetical protein
MNNLIVEIEITTNFPKLNMGGHLENKDGEICLRLADTLTSKQDGKFEVARKWKRPDNEPFDQNLYELI